LNIYFQLNILILKDEPKSNSREDSISIIPLIKVILITSQWVHTEQKQGIEFVNFITVIVPYFNYEYQDMVIVIQVLVVIAKIMRFNKVIQF
jgi:hypothetical protein